MFADGATQRTMKATPTAAPQRYSPLETGMTVQEQAATKKLATLASEKDFSLFAFSPRTSRIACRLMKVTIAPARRKAGIRHVSMCVAT